MQTFRKRRAGLSATAGLSCSCRRPQAKKERKGITQFRVIFQLYGERTTLDRFLRKIDRVKWAHDVIILSNFGFNTFRGFRYTGGQNLRLPIDFAGHRYNSAAATAQPVIRAHLGNAMIGNVRCL